MSRDFVVTIRVPELQKALKQVEAYDQNTRSRIGSAVQHSTNAIADGARRRVSVRTGRLIKKIGADYNSQKLEGTVTAKTPYAHLVEFGAKGATVAPKKKKALHFGGRFAASANIPERKAKPFLRPAFEAEKPNLVNALNEAVSKP